MDSRFPFRKEQRNSWGAIFGYDRAVEQNDEKSGIEHGNVGEKIGDGNLVGAMNGNLEPPAQHLVIMVNGINGSASDWKFGAEKFKNQLGAGVAIRCTECNSRWAKYIDGVDSMGKRLAKEVQEIIKATKGLKKISFVAHSLGGLVSRYAISKLYQAGVPGSDRPQATVAGLEPVNFITLATPHVGLRGSGNLPLLWGIQLLEKIAPYLARWFVRQTGKHLFMTDGTKDVLPLLRLMVTDCEEGPFLSSLKAFQRRTVYANVISDHLVGWRTSSLRRESELPKIHHEPVDEPYPHIVRDEEYAELEPNSTAAVPAADPVEEEILAGLNHLSWRRVDVIFKGAGFQAHKMMQVKNVKIHSEGEDVICSYHR